MKAFVMRAPGGFDRLRIEERPDPGAPGPGEVRVAVHATSLNYHDLLVATGRSPAADGRVLMSDGAGVVEAVLPAAMGTLRGHRRTAAASSSACSVSATSRATRARAGTMSWTSCADWPVKGSRSCPPPARST